MWYLGNLIVLGFYMFVFKVHENFVSKIWEMVEKIKTDVDYFWFRNWKNRTLKERHHFSFVSNNLHRNVNDKQNIAFPLLVGILTSTSKSSRKLQSIDVQHLLSSETDEWAHFLSDAFWCYTPTNSTLNYVFFIHDNAQTRTMNC